MRELVIDVEVAPNVSHTWSLFNVNVGLPQLIESGYLLCFAAKYVGQEKVYFHKVNGRDNTAMLKAAHKLLSDADVVIGYNSVQFDQKWFNAEFARAGMLPPAPYASVDLLRVVKANFRLTSNKLEHVASELLGEHKGATGGHATWIGAMAGNRDAWKRMREYNIQDVHLTERLYLRLKPWANCLPNPRLFGDADVAAQTCPQCGSADIIKRGLTYTKLSAYQRFSCLKCNRWSTGKNRVSGVDVR